MCLLSNISDVTGKYGCYGESNITHAAHHAYNRLLPRSLRDLEHLSCSALSHRRV